MPEDVNIGELLVAQNLITRAQYEECLTIQQTQVDKTLLNVVLDRGLCSEDAVRQALARYNQYANLNPSPDMAVELFNSVTDRLRMNTNELQIVAHLLAEHVRAKK